MHESNELALRVQRIQSTFDRAEAIARETEQQGRREAEELVRRAQAVVREIIAAAETAAMTPELGRTRAIELLVDAERQAQALTAGSRAAAEMAVIRARALALEVRSDAQLIAETRLLEIPTEGLRPRDHAGESLPPLQTAEPVISMPTGPSDSEGASSDEYATPAPITDGNTGPGVETVPERAPSADFEHPTEPTTAKEPASQAFAIQARLWFASLMSVQDVASQLPGVSAARIEMRSDGTAILWVTSDEPLDLAHLRQALPGVPLVPIDQPGDEGA